MPSIRDRSRCYPLHCEIRHRRSCKHGESFLDVGWTRLLDPAFEAQYWDFLAPDHALGVSDFFEQIDDCGLADEGYAGCAWPVDEIAAHLRALVDLLHDPPLELRHTLRIWDGPVGGAGDLESLLETCEAHRSCAAKLVVRKSWHW